MRSRGQLRPFSKAISAPALMIPVRSQAALADVEFSPARGGGRPGADHPGVHDLGRLSGRLRVCHYGDSSLSGVLRRVPQS